MARPASEVEEQLVGRTIISAEVKQFGAYEPTAVELGFDDGTSLVIDVRGVHYDMGAPAEAVLGLAFELDPSLPYPKGAK